MVDFNVESRIDIVIVVLKNIYVIGNYKIIIIFVFFLLQDKIIKVLKVDVSKEKFDFL